MEKASLYLDKEFRSYSRYILLTSALFLSLSALCIFYISWESNQIEQLEDLLVQYNVNTIAQTSKIEIEILLLHNHIKEPTHTLAESGHQSNNLVNLKNFVFSVEDSVEKIFALQKKYDNSQYQMVIDNLRTRWEPFHLILYEGNQAAGLPSKTEDFLDPSHRLGVVISQLKRMHMNSQMDRLLQIKLYREKKGKNITFFLLLILFTGTISGVWIHHKIKKITQTRIRLEGELLSYKDNLEDLVEERTLQLKKTNEKLLHSEKLTATGKLSACIAHEFNNPLCGVTNVLEEVQEGVAMNENYQELVEIGIKESKRMAGLIKNLQDFHRPTSGNFEWMDIHKMIDEVVIFLRKSLEDKNIGLQFHCAENLPKLHVIPDQIKQVILNLLQNASEAIPDSGGQIVITAEQQEELVHIHIRDTGCGISPEEMKHIFDPFYTQKPTVKGTGLGLSICHGIVKFHGGEIGVDSQPGEGTTITLTLPMEAVQI